MAPEKEKKPRMDETKKSIFKKLFYGLDEGKFRKMVLAGDNSKNMQKSEAWNRFTEAFNSLKRENFYQSEKKKAATAVGRRNGDDLNLSRLRRDYAVTGGGPATSESQNGKYLCFYFTVHFNCQNNYLSYLVTLPNNVADSDSFFTDLGPDILTNRNSLVLTDKLENKI